MGRVPPFLRLPSRSRDRIARDVDDEIAFHLAMRVEELMAHGTAPRVAREQAEREFGDTARARRRLIATDRSREQSVRRVRLFAELGHDARYAIRQLLRAPAFTVIALVTLALGIGANAAIFSVVNRLLLNPLPREVGERLFEVYRTEARQHFDIGPSAQDLLTWQQESKSFEHLEGTITSGVTLTGFEEPEAIEGELISDTFLSFLHLKPVVGRTFTRDETRRGAPRVVMLGYGLWQRRFGGNADAIGRSVVLDGASFTVIGVLPPAVELPGLISATNAVAMPLIVDTLVRPDYFTSVRVLGRLRTGVNPETAQTELEAILTRLNGPQPGPLQWVSRVRPLGPTLSTGLRPSLLVLLGAVGLVLLIACANVANLLLARAAKRERELAVRTALGAGQWRLVRQLLLESLLLAVVATVVGVALGAWGIDVIRGLRPPNLDVLLAVHLDRVVLAFCLALALATALLFGLAPALHAVRSATGEALKQSGTPHGSTGRGRRFRRALVVAEVALSVLLLVGAGLLARSVMRLQQLDPGFRADGLVTFGLSLPKSRYATEASRRTLREQLLERLRRTPGVIAVTVAGVVPPHEAITFGALKSEGQQESATAPATFSTNVVAPNYFQVMGIPLREGRTFGRAVKGVPEMIVSRSFAQRYWPGESAIGKRVHFGRDEPWTTIVGVVDDVRATSPLAGTEELPQFYSAIGGEAGNAIEPTVIVRVDPARGGPMTLVPTLKAQVRSLDKNLPVLDVQTVETLLVQSLARPRFVLTLLGAFALLALVLAAVGLYGVISYTVAQRTREIGIRMALGAQPGGVLRQVVLDGMRPALLGLGIGLAGALALGRVMAALLYGFSPRDPITYVAVTATLATTTVIACVMPARRAAAVDPMAAIRAE